MFGICEVLGWIVQQKQKKRKKMRDVCAHLCFEM